MPGLHVPQVSLNRRCEVVNGVGDHWYTFREEPLRPLFHRQAFGRPLPPDSPPDDLRKATPREIPGSRTSAALAWCRNEVVTAVTPRIEASRDSYYGMVYRCR